MKNLKNLTNAELVALDTALAQAHMMDDDAEYAYNPNSERAQVVEEIISRINNGTMNKDEI